MNNHDALLDAALEKFGPIRTKDRTTRYLTQKPIPGSQINLMCQSLLKLDVLLPK